MFGYVVTGVDGSPGSVAAAEYAAHWASAYGLGLRLVHGGLVHGAPPAGEDLLRKVADGLRERHPGLDIRYRQVPGGGAATLVEQSRSAALTVVGPRGHGGLPGLLLGSVASAVAAHAAGPVIVVHRTRPLPGPQAPVLVGVDGSGGGAQALGFAFAVADERAAPVVAVHAWWADPMETLRNRGEYVPARVEAAAGDLLAEALQPWQAKYPDVSVTEKLVHSLNPAYTLVEAAADAALLVVGPRGHGGFAGLLLGSVTSTVVQHAPCPVAVGRAHSHRRG